MLHPLSVLPLHVACQLLVSQNSSFLINANIDTQLPKSVMDLPSGYTVFPEAGVAYKYYKNPLSWNDARKYCVTYGSNLVVINSFDKIEYVRSIKTSEANVHVGIHRFFDDAEWTDVKDGLPVTAIPWRATTYNADKGRQCMGLVGSGVIGLFAVGCNEQMSFVCEVPIFKN